ncbi:hypothetical protein L1987_55025 [Smallanthus sonchifolius]|uniref:Uncharacterized protein n=1 Tax=Smallanthus sonchifolius TaxID=185202 RepID=A0ACB9E8E3_9ASTR|nr:hypothetical protein L1987_55025 [Smallanthus sonchifolius]
MRILLLLQVTSPYGNIIHHKENVTHDEFAFKSTESGLYLTCFLPDHSEESSQLSVELELRKLEEALEAVHDNLLYLKSREAKMRGVSETTNSRVAWGTVSHRWVFASWPRARNYGVVYRDAGGISLAIEAYEQCPDSGNAGQHFAAPMGAEVF